jgi:monoamine oxidase
MANHDILILGAGASGLSAAIDLAQAGARVSILEARERIGGRIFTRHEAGIPVELGAEFIHGLPPEIWQPLQERGVKITEVDGDDWCVRRGKLSRCEFFSEVDRILEKMDARSPDESFLQFLQRAFPNADDDPQLEEAKQWAIGYVSGFNAADPAEVSVQWLVDEMQADARIEGERAFHPANGYTSLLEIFRQKLHEAGVEILLDTRAREIRWQQGRVQVIALRGPDVVTLTAPQALITLPLGVLQARSPEAGAVEFSPALPAEKHQALNLLVMGKVVRVTLHFRRRFWDDIRPAAPGNSKALSDMSFLFSRDPLFPTWWTRMPDHAPILTGWSPAQSAERLSGQSQDAVVHLALESLGGILKVQAAELEQLLQAAYFHDWQSDPFSRGAYSYARVGGTHAPRLLGAPIEQTLFFAGEATDVSGHSGTVHGAIASGKRAAPEILQMPAASRSPRKKAG